jgi:RNA polymerase sigma-70 factor (ECF subfamily)
MLSSEIMTHSPDDITLMQRIANQDQHALLLLYQQYGKAVYSLAYRILQNTVLAEEATQDTFLKVWDRKTQWDPARGKLRNWLLTIAQFTAIDRLRKEKRQTHLVAGLPNEEDEINVSTALRWQDESLLHVLVAQLPPEQAILIELGFFQGMTHTQIAEKLKLPLGTVKTRVRSGLQTLRTLWQDTVQSKEPGTNE